MNKGGLIAGILVVVVSLVLASLYAFNQIGKERFVKYDTEDYLVISVQPGTNNTLVMSIDRTRRLDGYPVAPVTNGQTVAVGYVYEKKGESFAHELTNAYRIVFTNLVPIDLSRIPKPR